jgi:hypothetical protein
MGVKQVARELVVNRLKGTGANPIEFPPQG